MVGGRGPFRHPIAVRRAPRRRRPPLGASGTGAVWRWAPIR